MSSQFTPSQPYQPLIRRNDTANYYPQSRASTMDTNTQRSTKAATRATNDSGSGAITARTNADATHTTVSLDIVQQPSHSQQQQQSSSQALALNDAQYEAQRRHISTRHFTNVHLTDNTKLCEEIEPNVGKQNTQVVREVLDAIDRLETGKGVLRCFVSVHYWPIIVVFADGVVGPVDEYYYSTIKSINRLHDWHPIQKVYYKPGEPGEPDHFTIEIKAVQKEYRVLGLKELDMATQSQWQQQQLLPPNAVSPVYFEGASTTVSDSIPPPPLPSRDINQPPGEMQHRHAPTHRGKNREKRAGAAASQRNVNAMETAISPTTTPINSSKHRRRERLSTQDEQIHGRTASTRNEVNTGSESGSSGGGFFSKLFGT